MKSIPASRTDRAACPLLDPAEAFGTLAPRLCWSTGWDSGSCTFDDLLLRLMRAELLRESGQALRCRIQANRPVKQSTSYQPFFDSHGGEHCGATSLRMQNSLITQ